jgi:hypothetical protein
MSATYNFVIKSATYDGSAENPNPLVYVQGTVNNARVASQIYWSAIQAAAAVSTAAVRQLLAIALVGVFLGALGAPYQSNPSFSISDVLPVMGGAENSLETCSPALVPGWTATL